jgi:hypothetical protein
MLIPRSLIVNTQISIPCHCESVIAKPEGLKQSRLLPRFAPRNDGRLLRRFAPRNDGHCERSEAIYATNAITCLTQ